MQAADRVGRPGFDVDQSAAVPGDGARGGVNESRQKKGEQNDNQAKDARGRVPETSTGRTGGDRRSVGGETVGERRSLVGDTVEDGQSIGGETKSAKSRTTRGDQSLRERNADRHKVQYFDWSQTLTRDRRGAEMAPSRLRCNYDCTPVLEKPLTMPQYCAFFWCTKRTRNIEALGVFVYKTVAVAWSERISHMD